MAFSQMIIKYTFHMFQNYFYCNPSLTFYKYMYIIKCEEVVLKKICENFGGYYYCVFT